MVGYVALFRISQQIVEYIEDVNQNGIMNPIVYMSVSLRGKGREESEGRDKSIQNSQRQSFNLAKEWPNN